MKMVVVGGNSRDIGKTSVVAGIISALPHRNWLAIKLTQFGHGVCSEDGHERDWVSDEHPFVIHEEQDRSGGTDTSRFLAAGARRALWIRVRWGMLETVIPALQQATSGEEHVIMESNSILRFYRPNVYLSVLDSATSDFKVSAREFLRQADALVLLGEVAERSPWPGIRLEDLQGKPVFPIRRDRYVTPELARFVEARLQNGESARLLA